MAKRTKEQKEAISIAQKKIWRKKRKLAKQKINAVRDDRHIPNALVDPDRPSLAEWIQDTPKQQIERYQMDIKMMSERINRLEQKLMQVQTLNNALQSIVRSIQDIDRMIP
jgi:long-subunit acyl-CoA synthetase (AMP-forming)